jgi:hypothetical protein
MIMLDGSHAAADVVRDAFCELRRRWQVRSDTGKALSHAWSRVLNAARSVLRRWSPPSVSLTDAIPDAAGRVTPLPGSGGSTASSIEDRIRAATRAAGDAVRPDSVPALLLIPELLDGRSMCTHDNQNASRDGLNVTALGAVSGARIIAAFA